MEYPEFKVCCRCFTFNQAQYITDAMNGFTMQQTSFPFVCTIVDDASTDGEQEVIRKYVENNFDFSKGIVAFHKETDYAHITYAQHKTNKNCYFAVLYLKENHYSQRKPKMGYLSEWRDMCEYEAICEGDDYWIDPLKLQKQVSYLDQNPDCVLVYTQAKAYNEKKGAFEKELMCQPTLCIRDLLVHNGIGTLTVCYRLSIYQKYEEEKKNWPESNTWRMGDYPLWLYMSTKGSFCILDDITSVYRISEGTASRPREFENRVAFWESTRCIRLFFAEFAGLNEMADSINLSIDDAITDLYIYHSTFVSAYKYIKDRSGIYLTKKVKFYIRLMIKTLRK